VVRDSVEVGDLPLVPFDERFAAIGGGGGLGVVPGEMHQSTMISEGRVDLILRVWGLELDG
jgi:hypothetical protein